MFSWAAPENRTCCDRFRVEVSDRANYTTDQTEYCLSNLMLDVPVNVSVRCVSENNIEGIPSEPRTILNSKLMRIITHDMCCYGHFIVRLKYLYSKSILSSRK